MPTTIDQIEFDFTDTYLVSGIRKQGKSFFVRRFLTPILERQGKVKYWPNPQEVGHLRAHMHHIIDDFDQVPLKKIPDLVDAIQDLSLTGRHRGSGLTIVCHHPAWASKEFRLTPDHIIAFRQPKGESWYDPFSQGTPSKRSPDFKSTGSSTTDPVERSWRPSRMTGVPLSLPGRH